MLLIVIAFVGGIFTILSPCILPVVPFVLARSDKSFAVDRLPLLAGLALTFALATGLGAAGAAGAAQLTQYGRWVALALFALFGAVLVFPLLASRLVRPLSALADRFIAGSRPQRAGHRITSAVLLGAATGLLWAPCAGPILGLILTGAALRGASWQTGAALVAYGLGSAGSLAVVSGLSTQALNALKRFAGVGERLRQGLGALVLLTVVTIALGLDTRALALIPSVPTGAIENRLLGLLGESRPLAAAPEQGRLRRVSMRAPLPDEGRLPSFDRAGTWLNAAPRAGDSSRGKVTVINFWTYSCINCLRMLPYLKAWAQRYGSDGLVVIGVHTPEFGFERDVGNVKRALNGLDIRYPVAIDNEYGIWQAFGNQYWPAVYVADAQGRVRYHHFGEGGYRETEQAIRQLLADDGRPMGATDARPIQASGAQAGADPANIGSGETYVGYR